MSKKFLTHIIAKADLVDRDSDQFKAIASTVQEKYGFEIKPQVDLMYVRSCLVTTGMNGNDDVFLKDEMWKARHTPVMKPANWQHKDKDIVGVIYSVEARDLNGNVLDLNNDTPPDVPYEYWTEAVIFKLIHSDRATEIEERAAKGNLFVSMEAWFDDYDYVILNDSALAQVVARNENTSFLDSHLRINKGTGKYHDSKLGRGLRGITFGGYGFVDVPANKRSVIDSVISTIEREVVQDVDSKLDDLITNLFKETEEIDMNKVTASEASEGNDKVLDPQAVAKAVADALEAREAAKVAAEAEKVAKAKAAEFEKTAAANAEKVVSLEAAFKDAEAKSVANLEVLKTHAAALDEVVTALAGATSDTPPEISKIDAATGSDSGDAVFNAKIAWIKNSIASKIEPMAKELADFKVSLAEAAAALREQEVISLLKDYLSEDEVKAMVAVASKKTEADYAEWRAEKELFIERIKGAKAPKADKKEDKSADKKEDSKEGGCMAAIFNQLATLRRGANAQEIKSGVGSGALKNPRFKIAGGEEILDGVKPEEKMDLSAAKGGDEAEAENPYRSLATMLVNNVSSEKPAKAKAHFDPVE